MALLFSSFDVSRQVFFRSALSMGIVNLKPILPGHVLVVPNRVVQRMSDLNADEISDLFQSVQSVGRVVEQAYGAESLTIACQDGPAAGQSVPHVHVHILPRKMVDFGGNNDDVYPELEKHETTLPAELTRAHRRAQTLKMDNDSRVSRTPDEMEKEASWLRSLFTPLS